MHPIVSEQIARERLQELHREAAIARRIAAVRNTPGPRLALAAAALRLARALDRDGRVVPAVVTR
ncbi:MAG: hypothetical protein KY437_00860 [Actinobacteria bacterium]|nr:hypothetical protein [Actinomycetota bacterium]